MTAPAGATGGALAADATTAGPEQALDVFDWGGDTLALRAAANGKYVSRSGSNLVNDQDKPNGWFVQQQFSLVKVANGNYVLHYRGNEIKEPWNGPNQYIVVQPDGKLAIGAATPDTAAQFTREVLVSGTAAAVEAAKKADTAVVVVGSNPFVNGREDDDRQDTALAAGQQAIVKAVTAANPRTVVVLESSYPLTGDWSRAKAVLWTSHAGQETGRALADVLYGDYSPSGRLPQTWYRTDEELPDPLDFDVIKAGWTYQYHRPRALYPFGHGLTYGTFRYSGLQGLTGRRGERTAQGQRRRHQHQPDGERGGRPALHLAAQLTSGPADQDTAWVPAARVRARPAAYRLVRGEGERPGLLGRDPQQVDGRVGAAGRAGGQFVAPTSGPVRRLRSVARSSRPGT